jgi:hypothetical protein
MTFSDQTRRDTGPAHLTVDRRDGVTIVTAADRLFDAVPEFGNMTEERAREVVKAFREAVAGWPIVVVDFRRAGEVNKRALSVVFDVARHLSASGASAALCGDGTLKKVWDICQGGRVCSMFDDFDAALSAAAGAK